jgi:hypothetical protein
LRNAYKFVAGKYEGRRPHVRSKGIWEDNIRMNLKETIWEGVDWIHLAQDRN